MTDSQFDLYLQHLERVAEADKRGTTKIGRLYQEPPKPQPSDTQRDADTHRHNDEWSTE